MVSKSKYGSIRVHSTWAEDDSDVGAGTGFGALTGGLIGLLLGPGGALAGTVKLKESRTISPAPQALVGPG